MKICKETLVSRTLCLREENVNVGKGMHLLYRDKLDKGLPLFLKKMKGFM